MGPSAESINNGLVRTYIVPILHALAESPLSGLLLAISGATLLGATLLAATSTSTGTRLLAAALAMVSAGQILPAIFNPGTSTWLVDGPNLVGSCLALSGFLALRRATSGSAPVPTAPAAAPAEQVPASSANAPMRSTFQTVDFDPLTSRERRRRLRVPVERPVQVEVLGPNHREMDAWTVDFSGDGLGLRTNGPIPEGTVVIIRAVEGLMLAQVMNWRLTPEGFRIGLRVDQFLCPQPATEPGQGVFTGAEEVGV